MVLSHSFTIDPLSDDLIVGDAAIAKLLGVSPMTIWRYRTKGRRGIRLPNISWGRKPATTREAIRWWFAEIQRQDLSPIEYKIRRRQVDPALEAECEAAGI